MADIGVYPTDACTMIQLRPETLNENVENMSEQAA